VPSPKKALSLIFRNRDLDDQTIIPLLLQLFKSTYGEFTIKSNRISQSTSSIVIFCQVIMKYGDILTDLWGETGHLFKVRSSKHTPLHCKNWCFLFCGSIIRINVTLSNRELGN